MRVPAAPVACAALLLLAASVEARPPAEQVDVDEVSAPHPANYCLGGIEDRKIIVDESQLENPFRQTTLLGCEVDGGDPQQMPDLPAPTPILRLLA